MEQQRRRNGVLRTYGTMSSTDNNNSNNQVLTDEGRQSVASEAVFDAYPTIGKRSIIMSISATLFLIFICGYCVLNFRSHSREDIFVDDKKKEDIPVRITYVSPAETVEVRDFKDPDINAFGHGRREGFHLAIVLKNTELMDQLGVTCATPWLETTLKKHDAKTAEKTVNYNILTLKQSGESFLNVKIQSYDGEAVLVSPIPFNYKDISRASRVYHTQVTITHAKGNYSTQTPEEAFCIQELY